MDHRLAIVIVPQESDYPIEASRALLEPFQKLPADGAKDGFEQKFRYKRVGGWFDGLANGEVGQERWSTVLRMLLDGVTTNELAPFPGFGPETSLDIERRIETDNTLDLDDLWPMAPCTIIVTPSGEWAAHPDPGRLDDSASPPSLDGVDEAWSAVKRALFWEHRGATAVAWDLSWHFIGPSGALKSRRLRMPRAWGSRGCKPTNRESWPIWAKARRIARTQPEVSRVHELIEDNAAIDRWSGDGGASSVPVRPSEQADAPVPLAR
jgi:hypothetical protein